MKKEPITTMSVRLSADNKRALDQLALAGGVSLNQAVNNLIATAGKNNQVREEINTIKSGMSEQRKMLQSLADFTRQVATDNRAIAEAIGKISQRLNPQ
jgi:predicted transcriptional regulator